MKVKIGQIEISDITPDELDDILRRWGNFEPEAHGNSELPAAPPSRQAAPSQGLAADTVLLKKFVDAGTTGLTTIEFGTILSRRGKAARPALKEWAKRVGLTADDNMEVFEEARVGTQRGVRLKSGLLDVARHLMNQQ